MTEEEWPACPAYYPMLGFLGRKASKRKMRLFACACIRHIGNYLVHEESRNAVEIAERMADGLASHKERDVVKQAADAVRRSIQDNLHRSAADAAVVLCLSNIRTCLDMVAAAVVAVSVEVAHGKAWKPEVKLSRNAEQSRQALLFRHIFGNPFRPYPPPDHWPITVVQLANAIYNGQDCGFALHDALLEAGHPELAEHFRQEQLHPKGCWVLDLILGKE